MLGTLNGITYIAQPNLKGKPMKRILLASALSAAVLATPAAARDGRGYFGVEGGLLFAKDQNGDVFVDYTSTTTQTPVTPVVAFPTAAPADFAANNAYELDYKRGLDLDLVAGYDFGFFRLEGELGWKRAKLNDFGVDSAFVTSLNTALNRPSGTGDPVGANAALTGGSLDVDGSAKVLSGMVNALLDFGNEEGVSFYVGGGAGRARVSFAGDRDSAWAYQGIAGVRFALSENVDLGLKYRYFRTGRVELADDAVTTFAGNVDRAIVANTVGGVTTNVTVDRLTNAALSTDFDQKFRSHSLLASLIFNFGGAAAAPPPPPPPPAPVEAAPPPPATQTCPDGSVILATDTCPVPPPPPPPPAPAPERG
jgi:opacity protein-like surface antigen